MIEVETESNPMHGIGLPKWSAMVVVGKNVTREQAEEILIRTDGYYIRHPSSNERSYDREFLKLFGRPEDLYAGPPADADESVKGDWFQKKWALDRAWYETMRLLSLEYVGNDRICSCFIGGPRGWCDWDGTIGCSSYNIGKWPSVKRVEEEWEAIAQAFPFLELQCQLFDGEVCTDGIKPVVQFNIADGKVEIVKPQDEFKTDDLVDVWASQMGMHASLREVGIQLEDLTPIIKRIYGKIPMWGATS